MKVFPVAVCIVLLNSLVASAIQQPKLDTEVPAEYVIGLEDVLAVNVWKEPDLSVKEVIVRPDGKISLPLVGEIQASGVTPNQLQDRILERMKGFVASPNVAVVVVKISSCTVSIVGQVAKPGLYYMGSPMTVLELLSRAGGLREEAKKNRISIIRKEREKTISYLFNYKEVSNGKNLQQNIILRNGDQVLVP
jgi:polysaccharide biosynthesis/export protein